MDKQSIIEQIKTYLEQHLPGRGGPLAEDTSLLDEWFVNSMEIINLVLFLEKQFDIRMSEADISAENFATLATLSSFVLAKSAA